MSRQRFSKGKNGGIHMIKMRPPRMPITGPINKVSSFRPKYYEGLEISYRCVCDKFPNSCKAHNANH